MHAALLSDVTQPPRYTEVPEPEAREGEVVVDVLAAGLHHLTRAKALGMHYSNTAALPLVPGVDGVVRDVNGQLHYVALEGGSVGTFADRTVIDPRRAVRLPDTVDPVLIAAAMNPAMSSWVALRCRIPTAPAQRVLVLGATGNAGRMAVQIAKLLGAEHVTAAGRDEYRLARVPALGADEICTLDALDEAADADVVLDYVWGEPAARGMMQMLTARSDRGAPLTWVQLGSMASDISPVSAATLRSARLDIVGSGMGSVTAREMIGELPELVDALSNGSIEVKARAVPLARVASEWDSTTEERIVVVP
ncbi:zinc-binding dehydrogenase [Microbacterium sp.]|uniref:zinc-binding dehydrogenase n=1 Tax=Microbacterium sp. TaxID=51671 RepID=UPI003A8EC227